MSLGIAVIGNSHWQPPIGSKHHPSPLNINKRMQRMPQLRRRTLQWTLLKRQCQLNLD